MDIILQAINALISFVIGGGISKSLDAIPQWKDWHPTFRGQPAPFLKSVAVFIITSVFISILATLYQLLPNLFPKLPADEQAIIVNIFSIIGAYIRFVGSQTTALKMQIKGMTRNEHARYETAENQPDAWRRART